MNDVTIRFLECYKYLLHTNEVSSPSNFAKKLGVSSSLITEICKERTNAGMRPIQKLISIFPVFNATWLLTGGDEMLKKTEDDENKEVPDHSYVIEVQAKLINRLEEQIKELKKAREPESGYRRAAEPKQ